MKYCKDCVHFTSEQFIPPTCAALPYTNPVSGETERWFCSTARSFSERCGPDAKLYEPIETRSAA